MRRVVFLITLAALCVTNGYGQSGKHIKKGSAAVVDTLLPYQKYPELPAFNIRMMDSVTIFNTYNIPSGKETILMLFAPDCKHCKETTTRMLNGMDTLRDVHIYMVTPVHSMADVRKFYKQHNLAEYKNIKLVGCDYEFFFHDFYGTSVVPDLALYDANRNLVRLFEGETTLGDIYPYLHH